MNLEIVLDITEENKKSEVYEHSKDLNIIVVFKDNNDKRWVRTFETAKEADEYVAKIKDPNSIFNTTTGKFE